MSMWASVQVRKEGQYAARMARARKATGSAAARPSTATAGPPPGTKESSRHAIQQALVTKRSAGLQAMRRGVASVVGDGTLGGLAPHELACRLLGAALPTRLPGVGEEDEGASGCGLVFESSDWEADELRETYAEWLAAWDATLRPPQRCAVLLLAFGAVSGAVLRGRTCVLPSALATPTFLPEAGQLYLPMACSLEEFASRMHAALFA